jgi:hypothetical protein
LVITLSVADGKQNYLSGDYAPLAFHNGAGELIGYDVDMAHDLGKTLGVKVTFIITSWPTLSTDLKADKFDIAMGGVTETAARAKDFSLQIIDIVLHADDLRMLDMLINETLVGTAGVHNHRLISRWEA